jgi:hypothetical protein
MPGVCSGSSLEIPEPEEFPVCEYYEAEYKWNNANTPSMEMGIRKVEL